jgi:hypothetical protein
VGRVVSIRPSSIMRTKARARLFFWKRGAWAVLYVLPRSSVPFQTREQRRYSTIRFWRATRVPFPTVGGAMVYTGFVRIQWPLKLGLLRKIYGPSWQHHRCACASAGRTSTTASHGRPTDADDADARRAPVRNRNQAGVCPRLRLTAP